MVSVRKHLHNHSLAVSFIFSIIVDLLPTHLLAFYPTTDQYRLMYIRRRLADRGNRPFKSLFILLNILICTLYISHHTLLTEPFFTVVDHQWKPTLNFTSI